MAVIDGMWRQFETTALWKQRQIEDKKHDTECAGMIKVVGDRCKCSTLQEEIHLWEDWMYDQMNSVLVGGYGS